jgi:hypothetical protein
LSGTIRSILSNLLPGSSQVYSDAVKNITSTPAQRDSWGERELASRSIAAQTKQAFAGQRLAAALPGNKPPAPIVGPTPANLFTFQSQKSAGEGPGLPQGSYTDGRVTYIPQPSDGDGSGGGRPTPPSPLPPSGKENKPEKYSDEGLALSAEFFGALAARRRAADEALQMAMEQEKTQTERLNLAATTARTQVTREFRNLSEDMMRMLAGRGTARAPIAAGRGARRLQTAKDERFGQISQTLADEISALGQMVQMAESAQRAELARIAQDEALARTQPAGLLPAAAAFGGN